MDSERCPVSSPLCDENALILERFLTLDESMFCVDTKTATLPTEAAQTTCSAKSSWSFRTIHKPRADRSSLQHGKVETEVQDVCFPLLEAQDHDLYCGPRTKDISPCFLVERTRSLSNLSSYSLDSLTSISSCHDSDDIDVETLDAKSGSAESAHVMVSSDNQSTHDSPRLDSDVQDAGNQDQEQSVSVQTLRNQAVQELCETEGSFIQDLVSLNDIYLNPMIQSNSVVGKDPQIAIFFNIIIQLITLHRKLYSDLHEIAQRRRLPDKAPSQRMIPCKSFFMEGIGAVFYRYAGLFTFHGAYAKDYDQVMQALCMYRQDPKLGLQAFLQRCRELYPTIQSLDSLLIKPIQRIPRYKLLLERICEYTAHDHPDAQYLREAVLRVSDAAMKMNATVAAQAHLETILATQQKFRGHVSLMRHNRRLLKSGTLIKLSTKRKERVIMHLFNDLLMYSDLLISGEYRIRRVVELTSKAVRLSPGVPKSHQALLKSYRSSLQENCGFVISSLKKTFLLFASSVAERIEWVDIILTAIEITQKETGAEAQEGPSDAAALWMPDRVGSCTVCHSSFKLYFRRHHCRRCGAVVCGNCSRRKSVLFVAWGTGPQSDSSVSRKERVCTRCFRVLDLVRRAASIWHARIITYRGILGRRTMNKWCEYYFEVKCGVLRQYPLSSASITFGKQCTDMLQLKGVHVEHRGKDLLDSFRSLYTFEISDARDLPVTSAEHAQEESKSEFPINSFVNDAEPQLIISSRDSTGTEYSDVESVHSDIMNWEDKEKSAQCLTTSVWILRTKSSEEEQMWTNAIQRVANSAHTRAKATTSGSNSGSIRSSKKENTKTLPSTQTDQPSLESKRLRIIRKILRAEECYVTCMGECSRLFVQPLLLRHLESQQMFQQLRKNRTKRNRSEPFATHAYSSSCNSNQTNCMLQSEASCEIKYPVTHGKRGRVSCLKHRKLSLTIGINAIYQSFCDASDSINMSGMTQIQRMLLLNADMAVLFSSIEHICTLHQQLLDHLSRHVTEVMLQEESQQEYIAGSIFLAYVPLFELYISFADRHKSTMQCIESAPFAAFLSELPPEATLRRLQKYLNMPMQQVLCIMKLMQDLFDLTPQDHVDYASLQDALLYTQSIHDKMELIIANRMNAEHMAFFSAKLRLELNDKVYVKHGVLRKVCRRNVKRYFFVLMQDVVAYGRFGSRWHKQNYQKIDLWECKVTDQTDAIPHVITASVGFPDCENAFYFFSPFKSFVLITSTKDEKMGWMEALSVCIARTVTGSSTSPTSASRSMQGCHDAKPQQTACTLSYESANTATITSLNIGNLTFVIKNGWLNVTTPMSRKPRRLWITLTMQTFSFSVAFKSRHPEETYDIACCTVLPLQDETCFSVSVYPDRDKLAKAYKSFGLETQSAVDRDEWIRALVHCIGGLTTGSSVCSFRSNAAELRRQSASKATLAPIFMFDKVSTVCMLCYQSFSFYRPRHHCRYVRAMSIYSEQTNIDIVRKVLWLSRVRTLLKEEMEYREWKFEESFKNLRRMCAGFDGEWRACTRQGTSA